MIRIISIPTLSDFDRVRSQFQKLKTDGYKLTLDMANVIETRTRELFNNHIKSNISVDDADVVAPSNKKVEKVEELEQQLAEMKALLLQMNASKQEDKKEVVDTASAKIEEVRTVAKSTRKSPGRPRKN